MWWILTKCSFSIPCNCSEYCTSSWVPEEPRWNTNRCRKMDAWCYWEMIFHYAKIYSIPTTGEEGFDKLIYLFFYLSASASQVLPHSRVPSVSCIDGGTTHKLSLLRVFKGQKAIEEERHFRGSQTVLVTHPWWKRCLWFFNTYICMCVWHLWSPKANPGSSLLSVKAWLNLSLVHGNYLYLNPGHMTLDLLCQKGPGLVSSKSLPQPLPFLLRGSLKLSVKIYCFLMALHSLFYILE